MKRAYEEEQKSNRRRTLGGMRPSQSRQQRRPSADRLLQQRKDKDGRGRKQRDEEDRRRDKTAEVPPIYSARKEYHRERERMQQAMDSQKQMLSDNDKIIQQIIHDKDDHHYKLQQHQRRVAKSMKKINSGINYMNKGFVDRIEQYEIMLNSRRDLAHEIQANDNENSRRDADDKIENVLDGVSRWLQRRSDDGEAQESALQDRERDHAREDQIISSAEDAVGTILDGVKVPSHIR